MSQSDSETIADQNDQFRQGDPTIPGTIVVTRDLQNVLDEAAIAGGELVTAVRAQTSFSEENDPYGEHDFGSFTIAETACFWKIDLYNNTLDGGAEAPADLTQTHRVLTIMRAADY